MSREERIRARRFKHAEDKRNFIIGRILIKLVISAAKGCEASSVAIKFNEFGKPYVEGGPYFSLSHSKNKIVASFSNTNEVGVDIECTSIPHKHVSHVYSCMSAEEKIYIEENAFVGNIMLFRLWTRKEAMAKAIGLGLSCDLQKLSTLSQENGSFNAFVPFYGPLTGSSFFVGERYEAAWSVKGEGACRHRIIQCPESLGFR